MIAVTLRTANCSCSRCERETAAISSVSIENGSKNVECSLADFMAHPLLAETMMTQAFAVPGVGRLRLNSETGNGNSHLANGCFHCDGEIDCMGGRSTRINETDAITFLVPAEDGWQDLIDNISRSRTGRKI